VEQDKAKRAIVAYHAIAVAFSALNHSTGMIYLANASAADRWSALADDLFTGPKCPHFYITLGPCIFCEQKLH